jgi:hypothetical protein
MCAATALTIALTPACNHRQGDATAVRSAAQLFELAYSDGSRDQELGLFVHLFRQVICITLQHIHCAQPDCAMFATGIDGQVVEWRREKDVIITNVKERKAFAAAVHIAGPLSPIKPLFEGVRLKSRRTLSNRLAILFKLNADVSVGVEMLLPDLDMQKLSKFSSLRGWTTISSLEEMAVMQAIEHIALTATTNDQMCNTFFAFTDKVYNLCVHLEAFRLPMLRYGFDTASDVKPPSAFAFGVARLTFDFGVAPPTKRV